MLILIHILELLSVLIVILLMTSSANYANKTYLSSFYKSVSINGHADFNTSQCFTSFNSSNCFHLFIILILTVLCEDLYLSNGQISFDQAAVNEQYPVGTVATFTCIHGYSLEGSRTRTCQASGIWNQQVVSCRESNDIRENL